MGRETDVVEFLGALAAAPYRYDFYQTLRRLECLYGDKPRIGVALRPTDEPVRLGQEPDLSFAPAPLASLDMSSGRPPRLHVRLFGLLGPNGPLPIHITEYARERIRHANDRTLSRFLDVLQHRFLAFFYRAWAQAQPAVNRDRPDADRFTTYVGAFVGLAPATLRDRDSLPDEAKLFHAGALVRGVRNADGLASILEHFLRVPVTIEQFVGHWMVLGERERTSLGRDGATLGSGAVAGARVWDRQHKFRVRLGPLTFAQYASFLPGQRQLQHVIDWVRLYFGFEHEWDVRLVLRRDEVPRLRLGRGRLAPPEPHSGDIGRVPSKPQSGGGGRLGWTTWLGRRQSDEDAADLRLDAEAFAGSLKGAA
jgi:type VI secretion system protein ImpH